MNDKTSIFATLFIVILSLPAFAAPRASVRSGAIADPNCEAWGDSLTLSVTDGGKQLAARTYCSAYGKGSAKIVTDAVGRSYVLLETGEGRGTNATTNFLTVFELEGNLIERQKLAISEPTGAVSRWKYDYTVSTPPKGGIAIKLVLKIDGTPDPDSKLPKNRQVVMVGTH